MRGVPGRVSAAGLPAYLAARAAAGAVGADGASLAPRPRSSGVSAQRNLLGALVAEITPR